jgi:two-component system LytT family sensor kinase
MKTAAGSSYKLFLIHCLIWVVYMLYELSILLFSRANRIIWTEMVLAFLLNAGVFYATCELVLPWCARNRRWILLPFGLLLLTGSYLLLSYAETIYLFPLVDPRSADALASISLYNAIHVYRATNFMILGTGYWFAQEVIRKEKVLRRVEQDRYLQILQENELSKELAISELKYYRARLNPHFLFNTLNFFYANIRRLSKPLGQALLLFSQTMRYTILQDHADGMARLTDEIGQMKNYIELNQLRFRHTLQLELTINGDPGDQQVAPFILMTLLENVFKYGDMTDPLLPALITINIDPHQVELITDNKINAIGQPAGDGIGLSGIRKLLDLIYPGHYTLHITGTGERFRAHLQILTPYDQLYHH